MSLSTETFTTQIVTETTTTAVIVSPILISSDVTTTVTSHLSTTLLATFGQTVTILSPSSPTTVIVPTTKYTPLPATTTQTSTVTLTELDIYLQNGAGSIYSTWIVPLSPPPDPTNTQGFGQLVYVVKANNDDGWDSWSKGEKVGLIVGVVLAAILLFMTLWYCCRKSWSGKWWFAHGWPQSASGAPTVVDAGGPSFVQPTIVNGPVVPYQYGYGYQYGVGLRGGAGSNEGHRKSSGKNWFIGRRRDVGRERTKQSQSLEMLKRVIKMLMR